MRSVQVPRANGPLELVEKEFRNLVTHKLESKYRHGICHSDSFTKEGLFPGIQYPRVPGHEIAGLITPFIILTSNFLDVKYYGRRANATI